MLRHFLFTLTAIGLTLAPTHAEDTPAKSKKAADSAVEKAADKTKEAATSTEKEAKKTAAADTSKETSKKAATTVKKAEPKKIVEPKTEELSDSDKALVAHAEKEAAKLTAGQKTKLLDLANSGKAEALQSIPGVGEVKAKAIIKARPLKSVPDLIMVEGIGEVTFDEIIKWTEGGMKVDEPAAKETPAAKDAPTTKEAPAAKEKAPPKKPAPPKKAEKKNPA